MLTWGKGVSAHIAFRGVVVHAISTLSRRVGISWARHIPSAIRIQQHFLASRAPLEDQEESPVASRRQQKKPYDPTLRSPEDSTYNTPNTTLERDRNVCEGPQDLAPEVFLDHLNRRVATDESDCDARFLRGQTLMGLRKDAEAEKDFLRILEINREHAGAWCGLGQVSMIQGHLERAQKLFACALERSPTYGYAHLLMGRVTEIRGFPDQAMECYTRARECLPGESEPLVRKGVLLMGKQSFVKATKLFEDALQLDPQNLEATAFLGEAYVLLGRFEEARDLYDRALELAPDHPDLLMAKGRCLVHSDDDLSEAAICFKKAVKAAPEIPDPLLHLVGCYMMDGKYNKARAAWRRADKIAHEDPEVVELGHALKQAEEEEEKE